MQFSKNLSIPTVQSDNSKMRFPSIMFILAEGRTCSSNQFSCGLGQPCIPDTWKCDTHEDCPHGEDEVHCPNRSCVADEFQCANGQCITLRWVCDSDNDCGDRSDELSCGKSLSPPPLLAGVLLNCVGPQISLIPGISQLFYIRLNLMRNPVVIIPMFYYRAPDLSARRVSVWW